MPALKSKAYAYGREGCEDRILPNIGTEEDWNLFCDCPESLTMTDVLGMVPVPDIAYVPNLEDVIKEALKRKASHHMRSGAWKYRPPVEHNAATMTYGGKGALPNPSPPPKPPPPKPPPPKPPPPRHEPNEAELMRARIWGMLGKTQMFEYVEEVASALVFPGDKKVPETILSEMRLHKCYRNFIGGERFIWIKFQGKTSDFISTMNQLDVVTEC